MISRYPHLGAFLLGVVMITKATDGCANFPPPPPIGTTLPPLLSNIESCSVSIDRFSIEAQCTYPSNSPATGFQMIAGSSDHKLYVEQTTHTTATVEVEETGVYQVSIFPLREGTGILDSNVEYTQQVTISNLVPTVTEPTDVTTEGLLDEGGSSMGIAIGLYMC